MLITLAAPVGDVCPEFAALFIGPTSCIVLRYIGGSLGGLLSFYLLPKPELFPSDMRRILESVRDACFEKGAGYLCCWCSSNTMVLPLAPDSATISLSTAAM